MALGTVSKVTGADYTSGNKRVRVRDVQLTSGANYTTGGEVVTPAAVGLRSRIDQAIVHSGPVAGSRLVVFDVTNKTLKVFTAIGTEATASSDQSAFSVRVTFVGV